MKKVIDIVLKYWDYVELVPALAKLLKDVSIDRERKSATAKVRIKKLGDFEITVVKL